MSEKEGSDVFLRIPIKLNEHLRLVAKKEERKITTVAVRALKYYFKHEHGVIIEDDNEVSK